MALLDDAKSRRIVWRSLQRIGDRIVAVNTCCIQTVCQGLHRLLAGLRQRHSEQTACCCRQRQRLDQ
ncbi:MAG: hypothetical protein AAF327_17685 [Cyanobacteria bacterium P01_A01_bin.37]